MLVAEAASPKKGDYIIDMCAAPGGKSIHAADKMGDYGNVDARDVSQYKADLIKENIHRTGVINVDAKVQDATVYDPDSEQAADIVIADVPCSGYGVIGKKPEIKYRATPQKQEEIVMLQRMILDKAAKYVKPDGTLIFSTCTIAREENEENVLWFLKNYPFRLESLDPYIRKNFTANPQNSGICSFCRGYIRQTDSLLPDSEGNNKNDRYKIHDNGGTEKSDDRDWRKAFPRKADLCMASSAAGYLLG